MTQPDELKKNEPLVWSAGIGTDVWELFCACIAGDLATVQRLIRKDPSLVRCHYNYRKPLYFAVRESRLAVVEFLLERDPNPIGLAVNDSLLEIARDRGEGELETLLTTKLAAIHNISAKGEPVAEAIRQRDGAQMRSLLDASPDRLHAGDLRSNQAIHWAAMTRQLDLIDELIRRGADLNARRCDGAQPIHLNNGDYHYRGWDRVPKETAPTPRAVYEHLRTRGAFCDICTAAWFGDLNRVRELCDQDPSLANRPSDVVTYYACSGTPLRNAAAGGHLEIVRLLLERGADPNLPEEGIAPRGHALHSAVVRGHLEIVKLLLAQGAYPNVEVESSADTLSAALATAGYSHVKPNAEMVELLCSYGATRAVHLLAYSRGADLHARDEDICSTPLGWAAKFGRTRMVEFLLSRGARPNLSDDPPWATPLAWRPVAGTAKLWNY